MYFRPLPILTIISIPALAALIALGVWQSQRAGEKADQIAAFGQHMLAPPLTLEQACAEGLASSQIIVPPMAGGGLIRIFGHQAATAAAGWRYYQAADICGRPVLVETGFDALELGGPGGVIPGKVLSAPERFIVTPWPEPPFMAGPNLPDRNEWSWFDAPAITRELGLADLDARYIIAPLDGMPDYLVRTPPETHIGYAVTWFGMAIAFAVIYGLMHARAGRLRFGKPRSVKAQE